MATIQNPITAKIAAFLNEIGIPVEATTIPETTFLPGIWIEHGRLLIDESRLTYPGDLLHEAGHLAVLGPEERAGTVTSPEDELGQEIAAMIWSWAALTHLDLDPTVVFHEGGYKGASQSLILNFQGGFYPGLPLLQWYGMTYDARNAPAHGVPPFPHMIHWLRQSSAVPQEA